MEPSRDRIQPETRVSRRGMLGQLAALAVAALGGAHVARAAHTKASAAEWDAKMELVVDLEIATSDDFRYRKPFVAVWLEDKDGKEVRTLSLWVESGRGTRWISNLRRWYRDAHDLWAAGGPDLILTKSSATRAPGKYSLTWDGKDDKGKVVPQATYTLNVESAREHGPYGLIQKEITIGTKPFKITADGNGDIKGATVEYRKHA